MKRTYTLCLIVLMALLLIPALAPYSLFGLFTGQAQTITAASCEYTDVKAAVDAASEGDTVLVPAGKATWFQNLTISKPLTIKGNGTVLTAGATLDNGFFYITGFTSDILMRITGFMLVNRVSDIEVYAPNIKIIGGDIALGKLRIDHNILYYGYESITVAGSFGVIDNNFFYNPRIGIAFTAGNRAQADASWVSLAAGTANALFIENNHFITDADYPIAYTQEQIATDQGGKLVVRYNNFNAENMPDAVADNSPYVPFMAHGSADGGCGGAGYWESSSCQRRGQSVIEFYNNTESGKRIDSMYTSRGSANLVYDNAIIGTVRNNPRIVLAEEEYSSDNWSINRIEWPAEDQVHNTFIWNNTYQGHDFNDGVYGSVGVSPDGVIAKTTITGIGSRGIEILDGLLSNGVLEPRCCGETRIKPDFGQKESLVRQIAQDDFDAVWKVLQDFAPNKIVLNRDYFLHAPQATGGREIFTGANGASNTYPTDGITYPTFGTMVFIPDGPNAYYDPTADPALGYKPYTYPHPLIAETDGWQYDWSKRTDRYGKPAGIFEETPFPITENTTEYSIVNDEGTKTYYLGTKYYVDGGYGNDANDGLSLATAKKTIAAALTAAGSGNKTIIIRGAHDGFDGTYPEEGLCVRSGDDNTHRFILTGYGQERPVIIGGNSDNPVIYSAWNVPTSYVTIQRLKIQESFYAGIYMKAGGKSFISVIDVWLYHNVKWDFNINDIRGSDGQIYFLGTDDSWIFHVTSEHTDGHAIKVGDDADRVVVEWCVAKEAGYWDGYYLNDRSGSSRWASALSFPSAFNGGPGIYDEDLDGQSDYSEDLIVRYNICGPSVYQAVHFRRSPNFTFHHNEVYGSPHFNEVFVANQDDGVAQVFIHGDKTSGKFYDNIIRDPGTGKSLSRGYGGTSGVKGIWIARTSNTDADVYIYNNLIYGHNDGASIYVPYHNNTIGSSGYQPIGNVHILNNSIYSSSNISDWYGGVIWIDNTIWPFGKLFEFKNNIVYLAGTGKCTNWSTYVNNVVRGYNIYYHPNGALGFVGLGIGESEADPQWLVLPSTPLLANAAKLSGSISGEHLSSIFSDDLEGNARVSWDIGAYEYVAGGGGVTYGDVSGDGVIDAYDAALVAKHSVGLITLTPEQQVKAEVSGDGVIDAYDAALIAKRAVGLIDKFPVEQ